jgi:adenylate cyclase
VTNVLTLISLRLRRSWLVMVLLSLFATGLGAVWWHFDILEMSDDERGAYDDGLKKFIDKSWFPPGKSSKSNRSVIVAIDDTTFEDIENNEGWRQRFGAWPLDRAIYGETFEYIYQCGAKLIVFDSILDVAREGSPGDQLLGEMLRKQQKPLALGVNASVFGLELPKVANPVNRLTPLPFIEPDAGTAAPGGDFPEEEAFPEEPSEADVKAAAASRLLRAAENFAGPITFENGLTAPELESVEQLDTQGQPTGKQLPRRLKPTIETVLDGVSAHGLVVSEEDEDGKLRKTRFAYSDGVNTYPTLALAAAADALRVKSIRVEPGALWLDERRIAIDRDGSAGIDYGGTLTARFDAIPLSSVLRMQARQKGCEKFKDKYVFVAGFALATADVKTTPLEQQVPGVAKQIATFENLLDGQFITEAPFWVSLLFTFFVCFFSVMLVLVVRNVFVDIGWPVLLWGGFFLVTGVVMVTTKIHLLSALPSFAGTVASVLATAYERLLASNERERLREMFSSFMEKDLVDVMVEQKVLPKLDGEVKNVTAFFSDIKGFSTFSEALREDPKGLMRLLNRYLSTVTPVLTAQGACIDKYIGDAVVALFGAPVPHQDHALRACIGALGVQRAIAGLRAELSKEGLPDVYTRVGLNTDDLLVGNIGSEQLLDYTAIGDGMNLAARLEAANKAYGTLILMGENTYRAAGAQVVAREVDMVRVAGKSQPVRIYELVGLKGQVPETSLQVIALYEAALAATRERRFDDALAGLTQALTLHPSDGPSQTLQRKCLAWRQSPPPPEWDGVSDLEK